MFLVKYVRIFHTNFAVVSRWTIFLIICTRHQCAPVKWLSANTMDKFYLSLEKKSNIIVNDIYSGTKPLSFKFSLCHIPAEWSWQHHFITLGISFLILKWRWYYTYHTGLLVKLIHTNIHVQCIMALRAVSVGEQAQRNVLLSCWWEYGARISFWVLNGASLNHN